MVFNCTQVCKGRDYYFTMKNFVKQKFFRIDKDVMPQ